VAKARSFSRQTTPALARLRDETQVNVDALERGADALEARLAVLERRDAWFRRTLYPWLVELATAVAFTPPPELPR